MSESECEPNGGQLYSDPKFKEMFCRTFAHPHPPLDYGTGFCQPGCSSIRHPGEQCDCSRNCKIDYRK